MDPAIEIRAPYPEVRVVRQWSVHTFGIDIAEDGTLSAFPISDEQLDDADSATSEFDASGALTQRTDFSGGDEVTRESYLYDGSGRLVTRTVEYIADELTEVETREYDDSGRPVGITVHYDDGTTRTTHYTYDDAAHSVTTVTQSPEGIEQREWRRMDSAERTIEAKSIEGEEEVHRFYEYDDQGKPIVSGVVLPDGARRVQERYTYDGGRETLWEKFDETGELIERRTTEYEDGRILREVAEDTENEDVITSYEYDDEGNEIHVSVTSGTFIRETFRLYDESHRVVISASGNVVEEYHPVNSRSGGGTEYYRNASTTWYEYE